jgi:hypothetical protein
MTGSVMQLSETFRFDIPLPPLKRGKTALAPPFQGGWGDVETNRNDTHE